ncbi:beta strand repeat-containing protein, partial [Acetobacter cerevisiae]|uniref:beta strand repeat-containing protein n=1 Tax=Acetobacter cerevisiae TaxID=178900 RepID=UPI00209CB7E9
NTVSGDVTQTAGSLKLDGNTVDGTVAANGGTFDVASAGSTAGSLSGTANGTLDGTLDLTKASSTYSGGMSGNGGLTVSGGTETLAGTNTYTGATTISGGTLALNGTGSIADSSTVDVAQNGIFDISGVAAASSLPAGLSSIQSLAGAGAVVLGSNTLDITNGNATFSGVASGSGGLTVSGGTETLTGTNTYTGDTTINGGATLSLSGNGSISASQDVALNTKSDDNGKASTFDISGAGAEVSIKSLSSGTGDESADGSSVNLGSNGIAITDAGNSGSGNIYNGTITSSDNSSASVNISGGSEVINGNILGGVGLIVNKGSTLELKQTQNYTGSTSVNGSGSTLIFSGNDAGTTSVSVTQGGKITGAGSVGTGHTQVSVDSDSTIQAGRSGNRSKLTIKGDLDVEGKGTSDFTGSSGNGSGKNSQGSISVSGNLNLGSDSTIQAKNLSSSYGSGIQNLYQYGGTLTDGSSLTLDGTNEHASSTSSYIQEGNGQVNLVLPNGSDNLAFWDNGNSTANGQVDGGKGTWTQGTDGSANWANSSGTTDAAWNAKDFAVFENIGGAVTVDGNVDVRGMQFTYTGSNQDGTLYSLKSNDGNSSSITLYGENYNNNTFDVSSTSQDAQTSGMLYNGKGLVSTIRVGNGTGAGDGDLAVIETNIKDDPENPTTLVKTDTGTLVLTGSNSYAGGTVVTDGVLEVTSDASLGKADTAVAIDGGTLKIGADIEASKRQIIYGKNNATIDLDGHHYTPGAPMVGPGSVTIQSSEQSSIGDNQVAAGVPQNGASSVLDLGYDNTYAGNTTINGLGGDPTTVTRTVTVNANTATPFGQSTSSTKDGGGIVSVNNGAVVNMNGRTSDETSGSASLDYHTVNLNAGAINFNNKSTAGNSTIDVNTGYIVSDGHNASENSSVSTLNFNGQSTAGNAVINNNAGYTIHDSVVKDKVIASGAGSSNVSFNDQSNAESATINNAGNVTFSGDSQAENATIKNNNHNLDTNPKDDLSKYHATVDISQATSGVSIGSLSGDGNVDLGSKSLTVGNLNKDDTISGIIEDGGISADKGGSVTKVGTGTQTLTGTNTYTGSTSVESGTLALSHNGSVSDSSIVDISEGATFDISGTTSGTSVKDIGGVGGTSLGRQTLTLTAADPDTVYSGVASGTGGLKVSGGTETLSGANTYTGDTVVASGAGLNLPGSVTGALTTAG